MYKMPRKGHKSDSEQTTEAKASDRDGKLAAATEAPGPSTGTELTPALILKLLTTTIRKEISELRTEFLSELRKSHSALVGTIEDHGTRIVAMESALTDMTCSLQNEKQINSSGRRLTTSKTAHGE